MNSTERPAVAGPVEPTVRPRRYVLCPGMVTSRTDGQRHYVGPYHLAQLYGVAPSECLIHQPEPWWPASYHERAEERHRGLIKLEPRHDGNYSLPSVA